MSRSADLDRSAGTDTSGRISRISRISRIIEHVRIPLYRNAYSLVLSAALTSGIGVLFWILAARLFSEENVGINAAAISMLMFLATLGQLNLVNGLNRFLPRAGTSTRRLIGVSYVVAGGIGGVIAGIFLLGLDIWASSLEFVRSSPWMAAWFVFSVMAWGLFVLQDGVLTGLRQAQWVPVENVIYALVKIALVIGLAAKFADSGLFLAWTIPIPPLLFAVNVLVFRRLVPRHVVETRDRSEPVTFEHLSRFVAGDYAASLVWMAVTRLLPVIVLARVGAASTAHFYLAWTIAYSLYLVSRNMGMSMIAEASHDPLGLAGFSYRTARQAALLLTPAVILVIAGAPFILRLFGESYADAGTPLLRLLALSALPGIITTVYAAILRAERRIRALVVLMLAQSGSVIVLSYWLLGTKGIVGVGIAWLVSQTVTAMFVLATELRTMWISQVDHRLVEAVATTRNAITRRKKNREVRPIALAALERIADRLPADAREGPGRWEILRVFSTLSDVSTVAVGPSGEPPEAMLKLARTDLGREALDRNVTAIREIERDKRLSDWSGVVPLVLAVDEIDGRRVVLDRVIEGEPLTGFLHATLDPGALLALPAALLSEFHSRTASDRTVGSGLLELLVHQPVEELRGAIADRPGWLEGLETLEASLATALRTRTLALSRTHGDFSPNNILLDTDGTSVAGIIDWDQAEPLGLPDLDLVFLLLATRMVRQREELGSIVVSLTERSGFANWEQELLDAHGLNSSAALDTATLVRLAWLHHVASNLSKASSYRSREMWLERNIGYVLRVR